jgi:H+-transporting ATPase
MVKPMKDGVREDDVLVLAALASSDAGQDPVNSAIGASARGKSCPIFHAKVLRFSPFGPATRTSEVLIADARSMTGSPQCAGRRRLSEA